MAPPPATTPPDFRFVVSIHDVSPATAAATKSWLDDLDRLVVPATLLVIPDAYRGGPALSGAPDFAAYLRQAADRGHELSLHGLTHERVPGGSPWRQRLNGVLARGAAEFCALPEVEARRRLVAGLHALSESGIKVTGFTPPGWLASPGTRKALAELGFAYWTSHLAVHDLSAGRRLGMPALSHRPGGQGEQIGAQLMTAAARTFSRTRTSFRVALHPADLSRPGLREAAITAIEAALRAGARPLTYQDLVSAA